MKKSFLLILLIYSLGIYEANAQYGDFTVIPCQDSMDVINLFDSVFFSQLPSQNYKNLTFHGDPISVGY
ncbi:MAG: hypothetical protein C0598_07110, partial [Marinilabiliales bacterium]